MSPGPEPGPVELALGYRFSDPGLLAVALLHPSRAHELDGSRGNERLEFLGDAVLDLVVARLLFDAHPEWTEGQLTRTRSTLVNTRSLAQLARQLELGDSVQLGRTERKTGGADKDRVLACLFEAVLGAVYLDGGVEPVERVARRLFAGALAPEAAPPRADPKTRFQEWAHAERAATPSYRGVADSGVENDDDRFRVQVRLGREVWGEGSGRTKRAAERAAAEAALARLDAETRAAGPAAGGSR